jgi:hypothetical protein
MLVQPATDPLAAADETTMDAATVAAVSSQRTR